MKGYRKPIEVHNYKKIEKIVDSKKTISMGGNSSFFCLNFDDGSTLNIYAEEQGVLCYVLKENTNEK